MLLVAIVLLPVIGALLCALAGRVSAKSARVTALAVAILELAISLPLYALIRVGPYSVNYAWNRYFGLSFFLTADGLATTLVTLTGVLTIIAVMISWHEIRERVASFHVWLLLLQTGILIVFLARDLLLFYFGWELMLIPMFFLIGVWGHEDKLYSAIKFFLFTFTGSIFMLVALLYVYFQHQQQTGTYSFALSDLLTTHLSAREQWWVFLGLFVGFAVKVPLVPVHTWLPDAHTQAPTAGSLILAGLLLKTGVYGILRIAQPIAPLGALAFTPLVIALALFGIYYGAIAAFAQRDFKRLVAYSSISHMGFVILGLFIGNAAGFQGAVLQMVNHGLATGALFLIAGMLQERTHTRKFDMFGGLWKQMPAMGGFLAFFALASLGIPATGNFIGELYVIGGAFSVNFALGALASLGVLFAAAYSLRIFVATMHGPEQGFFKNLADTDARENWALGILAAALLVVGFYPRVVTKPLFFTPDEIVPKAQRPATSIADMPEFKNVKPAQPGWARMEHASPHRSHSPGGRE